MAVVLLTRNPGKLAAAREAFARYGIRVEPHADAPDEIQADTSLDIARHAALQAARRLGYPVVREDHALYLHALNLPGPYTQYVERQWPVPTLLRVLSAFDDRTGHFELATVYAEPDGTTIELVAHVPVYVKREEVTPDPRGSWDGVLCFEGDARAFSEYPEVERAHVWRVNFEQLATLLARRGTGSS